MTDNLDRYMTGQELAALLRATLRNVNVMARDGRLPRPLKVGRGHLWIRQEVEECLRKLEQARKRA